MTANAELVRRIIDCYNRRDADGLESVLHLDARYTAPGSDFGADIVGRYPIIEYFKRNVFPVFDRVDFEIAQLWEDAESSVVVVEWRVTLWPRTRAKYENSGVFVFEILDELVYWAREYYDTEKTHRRLAEGRED